MRTSWDIETAPLPREELLEIMPKFEAARNLKDESKIAADIEAKKNAWLDKAALSAITGRVLAIGILRGDEPEIVHGDDEKSLIQWFFDILPECGAMVGWNTHSFDLPFIVRRSWHLGVSVPPIRDNKRWISQFVDLRDAWSLGEWQADGNLDVVSRFLGFNGKSRDGKLFHELYAQDVNAAMEYLTNDLILTRALDAKMKA